MSKTGEYRIGTSGYQYDHWRGVLYEEGLSKSEWFGVFAESFDTVEINNTFYHLPEAETFDNWREAAPEGFCFVLKFSRYGTHMKKLKDPGGTIGLFLERATHLEDHLGPILVQLPPNWSPNVERLSAFLDEAPSGQRWAVEFRDERWLSDEVMDVLREHDAALCVHDQIDEHRRDITADWIYLRYHGAGDGGDYSSQYLTAEADRIAGHLRDGLDVFCYFNNDAHGYAVHNARDLRRYVSDRVE